MLISASWTLHKHHSLVVGMFRELLGSACVANCASEDYRKLLASRLWTWQASSSTTVCDRRAWYRFTSRFGIHFRGEWIIYLVVVVCARIVRHRFAFNLGKFWWSPTQLVWGVGWELGNLNLQLVPTRKVIGINWTRGHQASLGVEETRIAVAMVMQAANGRFTQVTNGALQIISQVDM